MNQQEITMHAKLLADNPLLAEIFDAIDDGLMDKARQASPNNEKDMLAIVLGFQIKQEMIDFIRVCISEEKVVEYNQKKVNRFF